MKKIAIILASMLILAQNVHIEALSKSSRYIGSPSSRRNTATKRAGSSRVGYRQRIRPFYNPTNTPTNRLLEDESNTKTIVAANKIVSMERANTNRHPLDCAHEYKQWLAFAEEDLSLAKLAASSNRLLNRGALYHSQQCAEKTLKAYTIFKSKDIPPRTHDLNELVSLCITFDPDFYQLIKDAKDINPFSTATRYPRGACTYPDTGFVHGLIKKSENILNFVNKKINLYHPPCTLKPIHEINFTQTRVQYS